MVTVVMRLGRERQKRGIGLLGYVLEEDAVST